MENKRSKFREMLVPTLRDPEVVQLEQQAEQAFQSTMDLLHEFENTVRRVTQMEHKERR